MFIFRVEDINGTGAYSVYYKGDAVLYKAFEKASKRKKSYYTSKKSPIRHPCPYTDELLSSLAYGSFDFSPYHFGFESIEQLYKWFDYKAMYKYMAEHLYISVYKVDKRSVKIGSHQIIFLKNKATFVSRTKFCDNFEFKTPKKNLTFISEMLLSA